MNTVCSTARGGFPLAIATFEIGACKVFVENAGTKANREGIKNQLAEVIQKLIENGEPDLTSFMDTKIGTGPDGDPEGYDPLPDRQTSHEEVPEQDPAATDPSIPIA